MDILIKNMEMPKACITGELPNYVYCPCFDICSEACGGSERPSACPLVALPPHGDLIERDALLETVRQEADFPSTEWCKAMECIENAPTVLEAST